MKLNLFSTGMLLCLCLLQFSCGKKPHNKSSESEIQDQFTQPEDLNLRAFARLVKAVKANDYETASSVLFDVPDLNINRLIVGEDDTLLAIAIRSNFRKIVELLLENKYRANLNQVSFHKDSFKMKPLTIAAAFGHLHLVKMILEKNIDINQPDENRRTPLHQAILKKHDDVAIYLIQNGANLGPDAQGKDAYALAQESGSPGLIEYLKGLSNVGLGQVPEAQVFKKLIQLGDLQTLSKILQRNPELATKYENEVNPLVLAISLKDDSVAYALARMLIEYKVDPNGAAGHTPPLSMAVQLNRIFLVEYLMDKGADVDYIDPKGYSALWYAVTENNIEMVDALASRGAVTSYTALVNGRNKGFNVCSYGKSLKKKMSLDRDLNRNQTILTRLKC